MKDLYKIGGTLSVLKHLSAASLINHQNPDGYWQTFEENPKAFPSLSRDQLIIRPLDNPLKSSGHLQILRGNFATGGAVAKITAQEELEFTGKAVSDKEHALYAALDREEIPRGEELGAGCEVLGPKCRTEMPES